MPEAPILCRGAIVFFCNLSFIDLSKKVYHYFILTRSTVSESENKKW